MLFLFPDSKKDIGNMRTASFRCLLPFTGEIPVREKKVIIRRYGIGGPEPLTVPEAAAYFHLSDKLLLNIEKHALKILRVGMNDGKIF